jgi:RsmE family RNA methyltransferase
MAIDGPVRLGNLGSVIGCDSTGEPMQSTVSTEPRHITVAIGPEGGWSSAERACFASTVSLGPTVLRVETAVVVAATLARRAAG